VLGEPPDDSAAASMWLVNFVLILGTLISLLVFGWGAYLETLHPQASQTSPLAGPVPLPLPRPKAVAQEPVEIEAITQPRASPNQRKTKVRRDL
jgi:hypothetical protein